MACGWRLEKETLPCGPCLQRGVLGFFWCLELEVYLLIFSLSRFLVSAFKADGCLAAPLGTSRRLRCKASLSRNVFSRLGCLFNIGILWKSVLKFPQVWGLLCVLLRTAFCLFLTFIYHIAISEDGLSV